MDLSKPDLKISLSPSQLLHVNGWLQEFYSKCHSRMSDPVIEDGFLKISSADVYNFLMSTKPAGESFDWFRLKQSAINSINLILGRARNPIRANHYKSCLELISERRGG